MMDEPVTTAEIETLQATIALGAGDRVGVRDRGALKAALRQPWRKVGDILLFDTAPRRVAAVAEALLTGRCFKSCNRKTTVAVVRLWMEREDHRWLCPIEELVDAVDELAVRRMSRQEFVLWVGRHTSRNAGPYPGGDPGVRRIAAAATFNAPAKSLPAKWLLMPKAFIEKNWGKGF